VDDAFIRGHGMKHLLIGVMAVLLTAHGAFAASRTLTGTISDSLCGISHKAMAARHGGNATDAECSTACVKAGGKYVFVSEGHVYTIANQNQKDLAANAGKTVQVTGDLQGTTIMVAKMAASTMKAPAAPTGFRVVPVQ
jgi:hypothetical protein